MDPAEIWYRHRRAILIAAANVAGLVIILGGAAIIYHVVVVPEPPDPILAGTEEVLTFIADDMDRLPNRRRREFMDRVVKYYGLTPDRRRRLIQQANRLSDTQIHRFRENVTDMVVVQVSEDAAEYGRLPSEKAREEYIQRKLAEAEALRDLLEGKDLRDELGKERSKTVAVTRSKLGRGMPISPGKVYKRFLKSTNPANRARVEHYVADIDKFQKQRRKMR